MTLIADYARENPLVIAALHLPPFPASGHPDALQVPEIIEYALRNTSYAVEAGVPALYLQDLGDHPWGRQVQPYTLAAMSVVGAEVRSAFPNLLLGICLMAHGAREPLAIAQAIEAQFVRIKVYVGAMVKPRGSWRAAPMRRSRTGRSAGQGRSPSWLTFTTALGRRSPHSRWQNQRAWRQPSAGRMGWF